MNLKPETFFCPDCNEQNWRLEPATRAPLQPKQFLVDGYTSVDKIPGKSFLICNNCGYICKQLIDTPESITIKFTLNPKK